MVQRQVKEVPRNKRKIGKIYANTDEGGYVLTYSILHKLSNGTIFEFERNTRRELEPFSNRSTALLNS